LTEVASTQGMEMAESESHVEIVERVLDAINKHNPSAAVRYFIEKCVLDSNRGPYPHGQRFSGKAAVEGAFRSFFDRVPNARFEDHEILDAGEKMVVLSRVIGRSVSGERVNFQTCDVYEFEDSQISRLDSYWKRSG